LAGKKLTLRIQLIDSVGTKQSFRVKARAKR